MAHKVATETWARISPNIGNLGKYLYNLDAPVGAHCPNRPDDVMLVQTFLKIAFDWRGSPQGFISGLAAPHAGTLGMTGGRSIRIDGHFDNAVLAWIYFYQLYHYLGNALYITGKVEPAKADGSSISQPKHTLLYMNGQAKSFFPQMYDDIRTASNLGIPDVLKKALQ